MAKSNYMTEIEERQGEEDSSIFIQKSKGNLERNKLKTKETKRDLKSYIN